MRKRMLLVWMRKHVFLSLFIALSLVSTAFLYAIPTSVNAFSGQNNINTQSQVSALPLQNSSSNGNSCALERVGWIVCPTVVSVAKIADSAFSFITEKFMVVEVNFFESGSKVNSVWSDMRDFANGLFVIGFLVIVYSLITGTGVSSYNLKRLVPRILVAAILVNLSFFICELFVDVITVIGASILDLVSKFIGGATTGMPLDAGHGNIRVLADIASKTLSKSDVAWTLLAPIVAVVFSAAVVCSAILIILILRKVVVVTLIIISPLAFVAYLLPNTEHLFSKWMKLFGYMMMLFPIISILLGTGQLVSAAIIKSGAQEYKTQGDEYNTSNGGQASATLRLVAAGAAVLPLAGTWYAFKGMTTLMDSANSRISRGRRGDKTSRLKSEKEASKREAAMDMNKKSQMQNGINKIQQITAMQDGGSKLSLVGRSGKRRARKKQMRSSEQTEFDNKVQNRLEELRGGSASMTPQQNYMQALQRYQDKQADISGEGADDSLSINSYEGIDLKASEAYLLESLGKDVGNTVNNSNNVQAELKEAASKSENKTNNNSTNNSNTSNTNNNNNTNTNNNNNSSGNGGSDDKDKKSAGISSLDRNGKNSGGNDGGDGNNEQSDGYHAPAANSQAALNNALDSAGVTSGGSGESSSGAASSGEGGGAPTVNIVNVPGGGTGGSSNSVDSHSGSTISSESIEQRRSAGNRRPKAMTSTEIKAKDRAARYVAKSQEAKLASTDKESNDVSANGAKEESIADELKRRSSESLNSRFSANDQYIDIHNPEDSETSTDQDNTGSQ